MGSAPTGTGIPLGSAPGHSFFGGGMPSSTGMGNMLANADWGSIGAGVAKAASGYMNLRQKRRAGKAELRLIDANEKLLSQQAQARAEDLKEQRAKQESSARAFLSVSQGSDAFKSRGSSASAFQREGERLFRRDLERNQANFRAQSAGIAAQRDAVKAGMPSTLDYLLSAAGAGFSTYSDIRKNRTKPATPTQVPTHTSTLSAVRPASGTSLLRYRGGSMTTRPGYGKTWWDR